ncbi:hypothetical protein Cme02nite_66090 [Catellatospora methionotrophica]|uniref:Uncharacterized protein n=1 Tax=Catellatospora methionotrophica TaxID=121620 RepID=A0A8J3LFB1_9ACTN|nr:hypothetical protein Cme02nite_66090 [Catellatospora methionotrophica]
MAVTDVRVDDVSDDEPREDRRRCRPLEYALYVTIAVALAAGWYLWFDRAAADACAAAVHAAVVALFS